MVKALGFLANLPCLAKPSSLLSAADLASPPSLLSPHVTSDGRVCGKALDHDAVHAINSKFCQRGYIHLLHDQIRDYLAQYPRTCGFIAQAEQCMSMGESDKGPIDLHRADVHIGGAPTGEVWIDVRVCHVLKPRLIDPFLRTQEVTKNEQYVYEGLPPPGVHIADSTLCPRHSRKGRTCGCWISQLAHRPPPGTPPTTTRPHLCRSDSHRNWWVLDPNQCQFGTMLGIRHQWPTAAQCIGDVRWCVCVCVYVCWCDMCGCALVSCPPPSSLSLSSVPAFARVLACGWLTLRLAVTVSGVFRI